MKLANTLGANVAISGSLALALCSYAHAQNRVVEGPGVLEKRGLPQTVLNTVDGARGQFANRLLADSRIFIKKITFTGNGSYSSSELMSELKLEVDKYYTLGDLLAEVEKVTQFYRAHGYLVAKAILPQQEIDDGAVNIHIFEGRLSNVSIKKAQSLSGSRLDPSRMTRIFSLNLCEAEICNLTSLTQSRIDRAINILEDVEGVKIKSADLRPGEAVGATDLDIQVTSRESYRLELGVDNFGNEYTGEKRAQTRLSVNDWLHAGDQLGLSYLGTDKGNLKYYGADYSVPVGEMGWRLGGAAGRNHYVISNSSVTSGSAEVRSLYASYPITRSSLSSMDFVVAYENSKLSQDSGQVEAKKVNGIRLGISGISRDQVFDIGRASNDWSLALTRSALTFENPDQDTQQTSGQKAKLAWRLNRVQGLGAQGWFAGLNAYGQFSDGNLDPYSKLALGGSAGIRAYASGEAAGDEALVTQWSFGNAWNSMVAQREFNFSIAGFYDRGWSHLQKEPAVVAGNSQTRSGYGLEFQMSQKNTMNMRIFWAKALNGVSSFDAKGSRVGVNIGFAF